MEIGRVSAMGNASGGQAMGTQMTQPVDNISKGLENKISGVQRQIKSLSSKEELSEEEKMRKRQELQKEMSKLNTQLRQHQAEVNKEQRKEAMHKESAEKETAPNKAAGKEKKGKEAKESETVKSAMEKGVSTNGTQEQREGNRIEKEQKSAGEDENRALVMADNSIKRVREQGAVIARMEGGMVVLKSEISQDENRGMNVDGKKEELARQERRMQRAADFRSPVLEEAKHRMKTAMQPQKGKTAGGKRKSQDNEDGRFFLKGTNFSRDERQEMTPLNISLR